MRAIPKLKSLIFISTLSALLCACDDATDQEASEEVSEAVLATAVEDSIVDYVADSRGWSRAEYSIIYMNREDTVEIYEIYFHADREQKAYPGSGKSFVIYFDSKTNEVIRELAYQ